MDWLSDILGGGGEESVSKEQREENRLAREFIREQGKEARKDVLRLFPQGTAARGAGGQAAIDVYRGMLPAQSQAFQQGNLAAQRQLQAGQGTYQSAILGTPQQGRQFVKPQMMNPDMSFIPTTIPQQLQGGGPPPLELSDNPGKGKGKGKNRNNAITNGLGGQNP